MIALAIWLASAAYVAFEVLTAPLGWQDERGFHLGEPR
jgi:hypothetical protein